MVSYKYGIAIIFFVLPFAVFAQRTSVPDEAKGFSGEGLYLYPLGWSSEGRWGALIGRKNDKDDSGRILIKVIDTVTDEFLYESEPFPWNGPEQFALFWSSKSSLIAEIIDTFNLESHRKPDFREAKFITGGLRYSFDMNPSSPAKGAYTLRITSSRGGYKKVFSSSKTSVPREARILGAVLSPFGQRAMAVIREKTQTEVFYRFVGAHLTLGFSSGSGAQSQALSNGSLLTAVFNGQEYLVKARLAAGADPNIQDKRGYPVILIAARLGHWRMVEHLLNSGAKPNPRDSFGRSALHYAAFNSNIDVVRALLAAGADKKLKDAGGLTAAHLAADAATRQLLR